MQGSTHTGSFRDPSGFIFERGGVIYRQVNTSYASVYDALTTSGLYTEEQKDLYAQKRDIADVLEKRVAVYAPHNIRLP